MAARKLELGATGDQVRSNVAGVRRARKMTLVELSERLGKLGRPIPPFGLSRLESGERRVDVDDLVALAAVFHVSPSELLGEISICETCFNAPPAGFSCNACGYTGGA